MKCPLCGTELTVMDGDTVHMGDKKYGVTVWCRAEYPKVCPAQEVVGHGNTLKDAEAVVMAKYGRKGDNEAK